MSKPGTWRELRAQRQGSAAYQAAHERTKQAYMIGRKVRELREDRGLSQTELAKRMGTSQSVIARLELGGAEPRFETLERVAHALDAELIVELQPHPSDAARPRERLQQVPASSIT